MEILRLCLLIKQLPEICSRDTSADPSGWTPENPTWGHCAVVATLVHELCGGEIFRASLLHSPLFAGMRSHYWNRTKSGIVADLTSSQFRGNYPVPLSASFSSREHILGNAKTRERYELLAERYRLLALRMGVA